jgi:lysophospholipase L1-like esterase
LTTEDGEEIRAPVTDIYAQTEPFWISATMRDESLFFISEHGSEASAPLLFRPERILSLRSSAGEVVYDDGRDYRIDKASGQIWRPAGSRMPVTISDELYSSKDPDGSGFMHRRGDARSFLMVAEGDTFHRRQVLASYTHGPGSWNLCVPRFAGTQMPRTSRRLARGEPLTVCLTGDSISEGYNASGFIGVPPFQPSYGSLVIGALEEAYRSQIVFHNFATAGWSAADGLADAGRIGAAEPDLVIVAYGMNDSGYEEPRDFAANIEGLMTEVRRTSSDSEFVLVSPMLPNPEWHYPLMERFTRYRDALARMCGDGVVLADVTTLWTEVLQRKRPLDLSGNGINHPNDFGHRLYAQAILALLIEWPTGSGRESG